MTYFFDLSELHPGEVVTRAGGQKPGWLVFRRPSQILSATRIQDVNGVVEAAAEFGDGYGYACGFLSYEAAPGLNQNIKVKDGGSVPLAWFSLYEDEPQYFRELAPMYGDVDVRLDAPEMDYASYEAALTRIRRALAGGESYQVNLTFRQSFTMCGGADRFFSNRCGIQPPPFATYIDGGDWQVASFSPELWFERNDDGVLMKPMKGTLAVGPGADPNSMAKDPKSIAENIMIVDMVRSELGQICEVGSVEVAKLLSVERQRGLYQMTSTVRGRYEGGTAGLIRTLFPPSSVTGAPKVSTCGIIDRTELSARGVYCGAIGVISPGWQRFSVGIRTAMIDRLSGRGVFGIGSGVVWDSDPRSEYEECLAKAELLKSPGESWALAESLSAASLSEETRVGAHLDRLARTAARFGVDLKLTMIEHDLLAMAGDVGEDDKVRVLVRLDGSHTIQVTKSRLAPRTLHAVLARDPIDTRDPNLGFKSTSRETLQTVLDSHFGADEVLLFNGEGELTEFCWGNVILETEDGLLTPRPDSGGFRGLTIRRLADRGVIRWSKLDLSDLRRCRSILLVNAVVGCRAIALAADPAREIPEIRENIPLTDRIARGLSGGLPEAVAP